MRQQLLAVILTSAFATAPFAQTSITYQGKLESGGEPFNGTAEMTFELHEADTGDTEIATHGPVNVEVSEGLFQEDLSFGPGAFDGDPRYLQIIIDGTPLAERHPIRPSPMALVAIDGDSGSGDAVWELTGSDIHYDDGHVGIGTASPGAPLQVTGSVIAGAPDNTVTGDNSFVSGGGGSWTNHVPGSYAFVAGGRQNEASGDQSVVAGGFGNLAQGFFSTVVGGDSNESLGNTAFVGGGAFNVADASDAAIVGGRSNLADGNAGFVGGGRDNVASGSNAFVAGGRDNLAGGSYSFAAGRHAHALHPGAFVWSDSDAFANDFVSTADHQFLIRAGGGVGINTNSPQDALDVAGRVRVGDFAGASSEWVCRTPEGTLAECSDSPGNGEGGSIWNQVDGDAVYEEGNVGIGTSSPAVPLQVNGSVQFGLDFNEASGINSFVTGGWSGSGEPEPNRALGGRSAIIGGRDNTAQALHAAIVGGVDNAAEGGSSAILGGRSNTASGLRSAIAGGFNNIADGSRSAIAGGEDNTANGDYAFIGGGTENVASGTRSFAAGRRAQANHNGAFVWADNVDAEFASTGQNQFLIRADGGVGIGTTIPGAALHVAGSGQFGFDGNEASGGNSFVTGGGVQFGANSATGDQSAVVGGRDNIAGEQLSVIAGGLNNSITGTRSFVAGGEANFLGGETSAVLGGSSNFVWGNASSIAGGGANMITVDSGAAFIGGGGGNTVDGNLSAITGGEGNTVEGERAAIAGGNDNTASGEDAFIGGGMGNMADESNSAVVGGFGSLADGSTSVVVGGANNAATGLASGVVAGQSNQAGGDNSFVGGGMGNIAGAENTFVAGTGAQALHANTFVWSGGAGQRGIESTAENQFVVAASGSVQFLSDENRSMGVELAPGGSGWSVVSDRNAKTAIEAADPRAVLERVTALPISEYSYKSQDQSIRHMGPMAQDFHPLFGLGEDELRISAMNLAGISLAAIQGLHAELENLHAELENKRARNGELREEVTELRAQVAANRQLAEHNAELEKRLAALEAVLLEDRQVAEAKQ